MGSGGEAERGVAAVGAVLATRIITTFFVISGRRRGRREGWRRRSVSLVAISRDNAPDSLNSVRITYSRHRFRDGASPSSKGLGGAPSTLPPAMQAQEEEYKNDEEFVVCLF